MPQEVLIKKRTVFYEFSGGVYRFSDWAEVITPLGVMHEPYQIIGQQLDGDTEYTNLSWVSEDHRVDELRNVDLDKLPMIMSNEDALATIGGSNCRTGR